MSERFVFFALLFPMLLAIPAAPSAALEKWTATSTTNAPTAREGHTAVWTGSKMIVWGGYYPISDAYTNTGGIYDPATDAWTATATANAPPARHFHTAVWTGSKMIVWGGSDGYHILNTGGLYDPATNTWTATSTTNAPGYGLEHTAVWTGSRMIVWGGFGPGYVPGGIYDPATNTWTAISTTSAPSERGNHTAVWTGSKMIVWAGYGTAGYLNTGGLYDPATNTWTATSTANAPTARVVPRAVWTGSRMIVWGGNDESGWSPNTGGLYDPAADTWTPTSTTNAPSDRASATAVWTRLRMVVWGGVDLLSDGDPTNTGGIYDPATDSWIATSTTNAPTPRDAHTAVWTGSEMIVWGGWSWPSSLDTGGIYSNSAVIPPPPPPADFYTVTPCRIADTRRTAGPTGGPALVAGAVRSFPVTGGICGVPSTATAVSVNLTVTQPAAQGYLSLYPGDAAGPPLVSNINFSAGQTRANNAVVLLAANGGTINVKNGSAGSVHFVLDVNGYFQ